MLHFIFNFWLNKEDMSFVFVTFSDTLWRNRMVCLRALLVVLHIPGVNDLPQVSICIYTVSKALFVDNFCSFISCKDPRIGENYFSKPLIKLTLRPAETDSTNILNNNYRSLFLQALHMSEKREHPI